jgi:aminoglycoside phosphotransferase (APT) family kinase protein
MTRRHWVIVVWNNFLSFSFIMTSPQAHMNPQKLHPNEPDITPDIVQQLLATQFPQFADAPLQLLNAGGTENVLYRLGDDHLLRFPRIDWAVTPLKKDHTWLSYIAPHLPLAVPTQLALGQPSSSYPFVWGLYHWLAGEDVFMAAPLDMPTLTQNIVGFIQALQRIPVPADAPPTRAKPLIGNDIGVQHNLGLLPERFKPDVLRQLWENAVVLPVWDGTPVWSHGDLHAANLLTNHGKLSAVIDFGALGVGDPMFDHCAAWWLLDAPARAEFRRLLAIDEHSWQRALGQVICGAAMAYPYYKDTNPVLTGIAKRAIRQVLIDVLGDSTADEP